MKHELKIRGENRKISHITDVDQGRQVDVDELSVPGLEVLVDEPQGFDEGPDGGLDVLLAVLDHLDEDLGGDVVEGDAAVGAVVLDHVLDGLRLHGHGLLHLEHLPVRAPQLDRPRHRRPPTAPIES